MEDARPGKQDVKSSGHASAAVITAIIGGIVTIITVALQFVIAPIVIRSAPAPVAQTVNASAIPVPPPPAPPRSRLSGMLPADPRSAASIDAEVVTMLAVERLAAADVAELNCWQLRVLRNVTAAFHGHEFSDGNLRRLFTAQSWYRKGAGQPTPNTADANVAFIAAKERARSCRARGV